MISKLPMISVIAKESEILFMDIRLSCVQKINCQSGEKLDKDIQKENNEGKVKEESFNSEFWLILFGKVCEINGN